MSYLKFYYAAARRGLETAQPVSYTHLLMWSLETLLKQEMVNFTPLKTMVISPWYSWRLYYCFKSVSIGDGPLYSF